MAMVEFGEEMWELGLEKKSKGFNVNLKSFVIL